MDNLVIHRMDHLGLVAGIVKELGIIEYIDSVIPPESQELITTGDCVLAFILNALGFVSEPLYMMPLFFKNLNLPVLFGKNISANEINVHKLSRALDKLYNYGISKLFTEISVLCCQTAKINTKTHSMDTSSFSLTGEYDKDTDTNGVLIKHGYSKDHRPDLKQVILELISTQDGGVPLMMQCHDGNKADTNTFRERTEKIVNALKDKKLKDNGSIMVADSKLYTKKTAESLNRINYITRISSQIKACTTAIETALASNEKWIQYSDSEKYQKFKVLHYGIKQRWMVVYSDAAHSRAKKRINKQINAEKQSFLKIKNKIKKLEFKSKKKAIIAIKEEYIQHKYYIPNIASIKLSRNKNNRYAVNEMTHSFDGKDINQEVETHSCYVIGTNTLEINNNIKTAEQNKTNKIKKITTIDFDNKHQQIDEQKEPIAQEKQAEQSEQVKQEKIKEHTEKKEQESEVNNIPYEEVSDNDVINTYKKQNDSIENKGFKFLKNPLFFVSSFFAKLGRRIETLVFIMCLVLLVYSIVQVKIRGFLKKKNFFILNQLNQPTQNPTLQWIFKLLGGIYCATIMQQNGMINRVITGLDNTKRTILSYFGSIVLELYDIKTDAPVSLISHTS